MFADSFNTFFIAASVLHCIILTQADECRNTIVCIVGLLDVWHRNCSDLSGKALTCTS